MTEGRPFTDLVVTVFGRPTTEQIDAFVESTFAWSKVVDLHEITFAAYESNEADETYHSLRKERDALLTWYNTAHGDVERLGALKDDLESWLRANHTHDPVAHCRICDERAAALGQVVDGWAAQ